MSVGKVGYVAPIIMSPTTVAPVIAGGTLVAGGLVLGGMSYGYLKIKRDKFKSYLAESIKEIKKREDELKSKYDITLKDSNNLEKLSKEILPKYDKSIFEILSSEPKDREKFQKKLSAIRARLNLLKVEFKERDREIEIYQEIIEQLEQPQAIANEFQKIVTLHKSSSNLTDMKRKRALFQSLKEHIEQYKDKILELYIISLGSDIAEDRIIEEHKSAKIRKEIEISVEKLKLLEPNYQFEFDMEKESDRVELIRDNIKIEYAQAKKDRGLKDKLSELSSGINNPDLNTKVNSFIKKATFDLDEYAQLKKQVEEYRTKERDDAENELIADEVVRNLKALGYEIVDEDKERLKELETVYIDIDDGYKLKVNFRSDNSFNIKFIRYVPSDYIPNSYDKQKDIEKVSQWCGDYDKFLELLAQNGLAVEHKIRLEPNDEEVEYIVQDEEEYPKKESKAKGIERTN